MNIYLFLGLILVSAIAIPAIAFLVIMKRGREIRLLTVHGVAIPGRVVTKLYRYPAKKSGFRGIIYELRDQAGKTHRKTVHLNMTDDALFEEGGPVDLYYMPDYPSVNALKSLVDAVK